MSKKTAESHEEVSTSPSSTLDEQSYVALLQDEDAENYSSQNVSSFSSRLSEMVEPLPPSRPALPRRRTAKSQSELQSAEEVLQESLRFSTSYRSIKAFSQSSLNEPLYPSLHSIDDLEEKVEEWFETPSALSASESAVTNSNESPTYAVASLNHTTEYATVMEGVSSTTASGNHADFVSIPSEIDEELRALKRTAAYGNIHTDSLPSQLAVDPDATPSHEATVVAISDDYNVHPAELEGNDAAYGVQQAELVAENFTSVQHQSRVAADGEAVPEMHTAYAVSSTGIDAGGDGGSGAPSSVTEGATAAREIESAEFSSDGELVNTTAATEATVIDSAPLNAAGKEDFPHWETTEEAQVLENDNDGMALGDRKPAAVDLLRNADDTTLVPDTDVFDIRDGVPRSEDAELLMSGYSGYGVASTSGGTATVASLSTVPVTETSLQEDGTAHAVAEASIGGNLAATSVSEVQPGQHNNVVHAIAQPSISASFFDDADETTVGVVDIREELSSTNFDDTAQVVSIQEEVHPADLTNENDATRADFVADGVGFAVTATAEEITGEEFSVATPHREDVDIEATTADVRISNDTDAGLGLVAGVATPIQMQQPVTTASAAVASPASPTENEVTATGHVLALDEGTEDENSLWPSKQRDISTGPSAQAVPVSSPAQFQSDHSTVLPEDTPPGGLPIGDNRSEESANADRTSSGGSRRTTQFQELSGNIARGTNNALITLFGDTRSSSRILAEDDLANFIVPRTLLPASVIFSRPTKMWIATLQMNQKALDGNDISEASKSLRAFSLPSERQAKCLAQAWTPPRMKPFSDFITCHTCDTRFAVFRRSCHCRNCGVCICKECSVSWPAKMVPETYNPKKSATVNVCQACDWLCNSFRNALLDGDMDKIVAIHATGNVNIVCPFGNVKGELFYPVHACVLGGSLPALRWLVDENCCPIKSVRVSGKSKENASKYTAIVTSKGRSLLSIAMENSNTEIVRYLVVEKKLSISSDKGISPAMLMRNLDLALRLIPGGNLQGEQEVQAGAGVQPSAPFSPEYNDMPPSPYPFADRAGSSVSLQDTANMLSEVAENFGAVAHPGGGNDDDNDCIICCDARIDCVATPCGHQVCCVECSTHLSRCPVCASEASFMRVFKP